MSGYPQQQQQGYPPQQQQGQPYYAGQQQQQPPPYYGSGDGGYQQMPPQGPVYANNGFWYRPPLNKAVIRNFRGTNHWATDMLTSCCNEPVMCLLGFMFPPCCVMQQRKKLLLEDLNNYQCCAGMWGPRCTESLDGCTKGNEAICLCIESFCCLSCAIHGNRWMVMQHYNLENDCADIALMWLACICSCLAAISGREELEHLANLVYYATIGCMLAQHEYQMKTQGYPMGTGPIMQ